MSRLRASVQGTVTFSLSFLNVLVQPPLCHSQRRLPLSAALDKRFFRIINLLLVVWHIDPVVSV
jgi:hypothetical protein